MKCIVLILSLVVASLNGVTHAQMKGDTYYLPDVDVASEKNQATLVKGTPLKYAINTEVNDIYHSKDESLSGQWTKMFDGSS